MRNVNRALALCALAALPMLAAVDGVIVNKSTGKPAAGVTVRLTELGQGGMKPLARTESAADGTFKFDAPNEGMYLLQANWQGVQYSRNLPPNAPKSGVEMEIFDVKAKLDAAKAEQHLFFLESDGQQLLATEMIIYANTSPVTWYDAQKGTARFALPKGLKPEDVKARITYGNAPPVERELVAAGAPGVYAVDYPVKPGETRFEINYAAPDATAFTGRVLESGAEARLVVAAGMQAEGDNVEPVGKEPQTGASIYNLKSASFRVAVSGTGSLRQPEQGAGGEQKEEDGPRFEQIQPPGYDRNWMRALALFVALLGVSFAAMYIKGRDTGAKRKG